MCARPPTGRLLAAGPGATAGRGSAVGYQWGYFHNGCSGRGEEGGEGEGAEQQPQRWLSKLGLAQPEASSLELKPELGLACPRDPQGPTRSATSCLPPCLLDQVKGDSSPSLLPNPSLPSASSFLYLSGWVRGGRDLGGSMHHHSWMRL